MHEQCTRIGETAGKVYQMLEKNGDRTLEVLYRESGMNDIALLNQAIGWLCREGKLNLEKKGSGTHISLVTASLCGCSK